MAQSGSALAWGARGPEFKSRRPDQSFVLLRPALLRQPGDRTSGQDAGRGPLSRTASCIRYRFADRLFDRHLIVDSHHAFDTPNDVDRSGTSRGTVDKSSHLHCSLIDRKFYLVGLGAAIANQRGLYLGHQCRIVHSGARSLFSTHLQVVVNPDDATDITREFRRLCDFSRRFNKAIELYAALEYLDIDVMCLGDRVADQSGFDLRANDSIVDSFTSALPSGHLAVTASHFDPRDVDNSRHENGEPRKNIPFFDRNETIVCLDAQQMGLGGASCGPGPLQQYLCKPGARSWRVAMKPVRKGDFSEARTIIPVAPMPTISRNEEGAINVGDIDPRGRIVKQVGTSTEALGPAFDFAKGGTLTIQQLIPNWIPSPTVTKTYPLVVPVFRVPQSDLRLVSFDSEEPGEGYAIHAIDGNPDTMWHTAYTASMPKHPHYLIIDLAQEVDLSGFDYLGRQDQGNGRVDKYEIRAGLTQDKLTLVHSGSFLDNASLQRAMFNAPVKARFVEFRAVRERQGNEWASVAELNFLTMTKVKPIG